MNEAKWVLSVACGESQQAHLRAARKLGYSIIGVDKAKDCGCVERQIVRSTHDAKGIVSEMQTHNLPRFDGVICKSSGPAVVTASIIANEYALPSVGLEVAKSHASKLYLHDYLRKLDIDTIPTTSVSLDACGSIDQEDLVIKPCTPRYGKKNVFHVRDNSEFLISVGRACKESYDSLAVIQPFIAGRNIGLVAICNAGNIVWSSFLEELNNWNGSTIIPKGLASLHDKLSMDEEDKILGAVNKVVNDNHSTGFIFFSFKVRKGKAPLLYEINPGLCGDFLADVLLPAMWPGVDFFELDILNSTGRPCNPPVSPPEDVVVTYSVKSSESGGNILSDPVINRI